MMRRAIVSSSFLIFPMMIGMAVVAEPLVKIVLTDKWLEAVPFLKIFLLYLCLVSQFIQQIYKPLMLWVEVIFL